MADLKISVKIVADVPVSQLKAFSDDAWAGIQEWCYDATFADDEVVIDAYVNPDDREAGIQSYTVTWQTIADALAKMATGFYTRFDGTDARLSEYHSSAAMAMLFAPDEADYDSETWDTALQMAVLGGVMYA